MGWLASIFGRSEPAAAPVPMLSLKADGIDTLKSIHDPGLVELYDRPTLNREFVEYLYETNKLAARIIDTLPEDMTQLPLEIDAGIFNGKKISEAIDEQHGRMLASHAMIYSRLYGGAGLLAFVEDGREPHEPVDFFNVTHIAGFAALHRYELRVEKWDRNPASRIAGLPNYGQPIMYRAQPVDGSSATANGRSVAGLWHRSRVIPWVNIPTLTRYRRERYQGWSPGELERIITELLARTGGMGHIDNLLRSFGFDVVAIQGLREQLSSENGSTEVQKRLRQLSKSLQITAGGVRVVAVDAGAGPQQPPETLTPMARPVNGVRDLSDAQADHLQEVTDYPRSILYQRINAGMGNGEALGELQAYYGTVKRRQPREYVPQMRQMAELLCAAKDGPTGGIRPAHMLITCPSLWSTPEDVAAKTRLENAQASDLEGKVLTLAERRTNSTLRTNYTMEPDEKALPILEALNADELRLGLDVQAAQAGDAGVTPDAARALIRLGPPRLAAGADDLVPDLTADAELLPGEEAEPWPTDLRTEPEIRKMLRIGKKGLADYVAEGKMRPYPVRGRRKYSEAEVVAVLRAEREAALTADAQDLVDGLSWRMVRRSDETGVSGTGEVVRGLVLHDGSVISWWVVEGMPPRPHIDKNWTEFYAVHIEQHPSNGTLVQQWFDYPGASVPAGGEWVDVADLAVGPR